MGKRRPKAFSGKGNDRPVKRPKPQNSKQQSTATDLDHVCPADYVIINNVMYVRPYVFEFKCHYKPRWKNRAIFEVFVTEFRHADRDYWQFEFDNGRVLSDGSPVSRTALWIDGIQVVHVVHRHESAVRAGGIHIAVDDDDFVVVSKPPSIPVHPCGTYRKNCLQFVLRAFHGFDHLQCVHRLDKETSGLVVLAKTKQAAASFNERIKTRDVIKTYVAEVCGLFPTGGATCDQPIFWDNRLMKAFARQDDGAQAETAFKLLSRHPGTHTSIVECKPVTGRTHQIRVHLAHLGYPIVNDRLYGNADPASSQNNYITKMSLHDQRFYENAATHTLRKSKLAGFASACMQAKQELTVLEEGEVLGCANCPQVTNVKNVCWDSMEIHLHALKYECADWRFEVPLPRWMTHRDTGLQSFLCRVCNLA